MKVVKRLFGFILIAQTDQPLNTSKNDLAVDGYDLVSYFDGQPTLRMEYLSVVYEGATYYFVTAHNQSLFVESPERYLPQYGEWCAFAMGKKGAKFDVDLMSYKIIESKPYMFF